MIFPVIGLFACNQGNDQKQVIQTDTATKLNTQVTDSLVAGTRVDSSGKTVTIPASQLIVPGKSIGLTRIGQTAEETVAVLGKPDEGDAAMGKSLSTWYSKNNPAYKTQVYSSIQSGADGDMPKVKSIRINNPFFETVNGIKTGSTLKEILAQFPAILLTGSYRSFNKTIKVYDDAQAGIAFEIDGNDICKGICVHSTDEKAHVQYLPFEGSFKVMDN